MNQSKQPFRAKGLPQPFSRLCAGLLLLFLGALPALAQQEPPGCTGSGLGILLYTDAADVHIGDTLNYSVTVFNGTGNGPVVCDASSIQASVVTPDGVSHPISLVRTALTNGQSDFYSNVVSYVVRAQDIQPNQTVDATASDTGIIHQNINNSEGGGNQGVNTQVSLPCVLLTVQCAGGVGQTGPISFTGTITNCGNDTLVNVTVTNFDDSGHQTQVAFVTNLLSGQVAAFSGSWIPASPCAPSTVTLTVQGTDQFTTYPKTVSSSDSVTCSETVTPGLAVTKTCPAGPVAPGQLLTFSGSVSNTGNVTLTNIVVVNNQPAPNTAVFTLASLAPGVVVDFTGSYPAPANCAVSDTLTATAASVCGVAVSSSVSATCPITTTAQIAVTQSCPASPASPGGLLTYSGTVSNAGNIMLTNVVVLNNLSGGTPVFTAVALAPGAVSNFTGSYIAPANCASTSTSTATAESICGVAVTNAASTTCPIATTPILAVRQACPVSPVSPGGLLTYSGTVSNVGNITITNVVVLNNQSGSTPIFTAASLAPGAGASFTGSYLAPANCTASSTSTATGQSVCGVSVTNAASATCPITTRPNITVTLNCSTNPALAGGLLTYSGTVSNAGNITLTNVVVVNNQSGSTPVFTTPSLAPGAAAAFTGSYVAPTNCSSASTVTATGGSVCGVTVTSTAGATCPVVTFPAIVVTQTCPTNPVAPGGILTYSGTVSNAGGIILTNIIVVDNEPASNTVILTVAALAPGATTNFTGSYLVPLNCCVVSSIVEASGQGCAGVTVTDSAERTCNVFTSPQIVVTKMCAPGVLQWGDVMTYSGTVSNAGNISLTNVTVVNTEPFGGSLLLGPITLAPGESQNYTASYIIPQDFCGADTVTARGLDICAFNPITSSVTVGCPVIIPPPSIAVTMNCPLQPTPRGGLYSFTGTVSNSGPITLINVVVVDSQPTNNSPVIGPITLAPGVSVNFTNSYIAPNCCCFVLDILTASGQDHCLGSNATATVATECPLLSIPSIGVVQNCPPNPIPMGSVYQFNGYVTNTGNTVLTNVFVFGPQGTNAPLVAAIELAPGQSQSYSGSYTVPFNTCSVTVTAIGQDICGGTATNNTASCPVATTPMIAVTQVCPVNPVSSGGLLTYSGTVSNAGNITLANVVVLNNQSGTTPIFTTPTLAPGAVASFTGSYLAPANCSSTSTSTATGQSICGVAVTNAASSTCPIITTPLLAVTQNCPVNLVRPGGLLTYSGTVSNAGNIMLTNVVVLNNQSGATPVFNAATLPPGAVSNFTGSYLAPTNCSSTSTSIATGRSICGVGVTNTATTICPIVTTPLLAITQNCPLNPVSAGSLLTYTGSVSNAGNVTLNNIVVTNSQSGTTPILTVLTLAPGASMNFTGSYLAPANCSSASTSTAIGQSLCGISVTNMATTICPIVTSPLLAITQNCPVNPANPGGLLTYSGMVSNAGNVTLNNIIVTNSQSGTTPILTVLTLAPGASMNFTGSYLAPANCSSASTSTATGQSLCGVGVTNMATTICPIGTTALLDITQVCPVNPVSPGGLLTYSGTVSNAGNSTLTNVVVLNNLSGTTPIFTAATLAPGAAANFTGSYLAPANCSSTSTSTATGLGVCGLDVSNSASTTCPITFSPAIGVTESCPPSPVSVGSTVTFGGEVSNTGNIALTNVLVFSSQPSSNTLVLGPITLAAGASAPFTGSFIALGGSNVMTNITILTNSSSVIMTNTNSVVVTNTTNIITTNSVTSTFGTIDPVTGILTDRFTVPADLHGLMYADQNENWGPTLFYSIREPAGGPDEFDTISTIAPNAGQVADRFTLSSSNYDALTLAAPDVGYGAVNFYYIRHDATGAATFGEIIAQGASSSMDLWPLANTGYTGLTFAAANVDAYGANLFYYVRDSVNGIATFGIINPTPGGSEMDEYTVGTNFDSLVYVSGAVSTWGTGLFAYLRHDTVGSIIGTINPLTHVATDRINLGTNFLSALTYTTTDVGYGPDLFYYLRPGGISLATNLSTNFTTNIVITFTTNTVNTYTTNTLVTFTPTNTVTAFGTDICRDQTVSAAANCAGPIAAALPAPVFGALAIMPNGTFSLSFASQSGISYTVQYNNSLNQSTWIDLETVVGTGGNMTVTDGIVSQRPMRFYRVLLTP